MGVENLACILIRFRSKITRKLFLWLMLQLISRHFLIFHSLFSHINIQYATGLLLDCISMHCRHIHQCNCTYGCHSMFCTQGWSLAENVSVLRLPLANVISFQDQRPLLVPPGAWLGLYTCWLHEYLTEKWKRDLLVIHLLSCWSCTRDPWIGCRLLP